LVRKTRKIKDKWKEKRWVSVFAPESFNNIPIAYVPITSDKTAVGRVVEVTLFDILKGDPSQHQYKLFFKIDKVTEEKATTIFKRYEYAKEFLRSLIRRGSSRINFVIDTKTKDGYVFRIKILTLSHRELNTSRKRALRLEAKKQIERIVPQMTIDEFVQAACYGKINSDIMAATKKIFVLDMLVWKKSNCLRHQKKKLLFSKLRLRYQISI